MQYIGQNLIHIGRANESHRAEWDKFLLSCNNATFFHQFDWSKVVKSTYGHKPYYLYATKDKEIVGIFPLFFMKGGVFGKYLVSLPYCDYGGPLSNYQDIENQLIKRSMDICEKLGADFLEIRTEKNYKNPKMIIRDDKANLTLKLKDNWKILWDSFKPKVRNQIRKAQKNNLIFKVSTTSTLGLSDFYKVFSQNMRDLGTPVHSIKFFSKIIETFPESSNFAHVIYDGQVIASSLFIKFKDYLEVPFASSIKKFRSLCPNNLLYWEIIKMACQKGSKQFVFGRSSWNSGTFNFKKQWGAVPHQLHYQYYLDKIDEIPGLNPNNEKYQLAIALWKKLPVPLTRFFGPRIMRNIP